uniref:Uncharacterized protein n=1 Tax=Ursus maritimus TaxID=29073 RepID=A0A452TAN5_URSMA
IQQFGVCSPVKSFNLREGWPHILALGHRLARDIFGQKDFEGKPEIPSHLPRGKVAALSSAHPVGWRHQGSFFDYQGLPLTAQLLVLSDPSPSSQLQRGLVRW